MQTIADVAREAGRHPVPNELLFLLCQPLGLVLTERWQWLTYLAIRLSLAAALIALLLLFPSCRKTRQ